MSDRRELELTFERALANVELAGSSGSLLACLASLRTLRIAWTALQLEREQDRAALERAESRAATFEAAATRAKLRQP
jgi:hypothetical protein